MNDPLHARLSALGLSLIGEIANTPAAKLYHVTRSDTECVLKVYHSGRLGNEAPGATVMRAWATSGAMVEIFDTYGDAILMQRLDGPLLGDLVRDGQDDIGCEHLANTARRLHQSPPNVSAPLPPLDAWFQALFDLRFSDTCTEDLRANMRQAAELARTLLRNTSETVVLHGDLHHDNVVLTQTGPVAFDAKGVRGDKAYDLANAIRNPKGAFELVNNPDRIARCVAHYAGMLNVSEQRMSDWAAAKCALSIAWRAKGVLTSDPEAELLATLLRLAHPV